MKKRTNAGPYSADELEDLFEFHCQLVQLHVFNYATGGALWQSQQGAVADLPFAPVLRMVNDYFDESSSLSEADRRDLLTRTGAHMATAINANDADYFRRLAVVLEARKEGRALTSLSRRDLLLPARRGRAKTPHDLSRVFPLSLYDATRTRLKSFADAGELTSARVTRDELKRIVRANGGTISEQELSRQITNFKFGRFMAEQPIALKPPKMR